jgi:soluble lytic murein transglycosylase
MLGTVLAVLGNYSVAQAQSAGQTGDQTALAVPRIQLHGAAGVGLPQPFSPSDSALVRRIFALQDGGSVTEAVRETARLRDELLLGTILADRYLRTSYRATAEELTTWLARFGEQPEAPAIRGLLDRLVPELARREGAGPSDRPARGASRAVQEPQLRSLFVQNRDGAVVAAAEPLLADTSERGSAEARLVGGLSALRLRQVDAAYAFFTSAYRAASTATLRAASAFWAGRTAERRGDRGGFAMWMRRAALEGETFYGLIARRALGPTMACVPGATIGDADVEALVATPQGRRAFALLQVGEKRQAEAELRALWLDTADQGLLDRPLILVARAVGLGQLAAEIEQNGLVQRRPEDASFVSLRPEGGFLVDPPLVYGLVRHESNFRPVAVSSSGARGLMQIMPRTAHAVAGDKAARLQDPAVNLAIGQRYLLVLAADEAIDGDLIRLLAGYGQGQGGLRKWVDAVRDDGDPLMFIEAIPNGATRAFVQDALVYSWHYAAVLHLPATSLDELAAGRYPRLLRAGAHQPANGRAGICAQAAAR